MSIRDLPRRTVAALAAGALVLAGAVTGVVVAHETSSSDTHAQQAAERGHGEEGDGDSAEEREHERHNAAGEAGEESETLHTAFDQFRGARQLGLLTDPGVYSDAYDHWRAMPTSGGAWQEVTTAPYNSDAVPYRDPVSSNSGGGASFVTGRIVGLATDPAHHAIYAAGAQGGVFRSLTGGSSWVPISDQIVNLATGDLRVNPADGSLWYGTGEPNYGNELGRGIYRLAQPWLAGSRFTEGDRVGGEELESHWVGKIAFDTTYAYAATSRGVYRFPLAKVGNATATWTNVLHPEPVQDSVTKNIANDIVVQPGTGYLVANLAYRSTLPYNGFYISKDQGNTWTKSKPLGAINPKEVGPSDMAYSADGSALYIVMESTVGFDTKNSALAGVYESPNGKPEGPWSQIADASKLANSGSALKTPGDHSYPVGVQAWYNRFIGVDPHDKNHVYVGLEEVFETHNAGTSWKTIGRYWDFGFPCQPSGTCDHDVLHSDQHSIAFDGTYVYAGNDGGLYRRTIAGDNGWTSLTADGSLRALQYYGIGVGTTTGGVAVWGGMQDNGVSLLRPAAKDNGQQVSPMGGDGGMMIVNPDNGCEAVGEYTNLTLQLTRNCGESPADDPTIEQIAPGDPNGQFIAPFVADDNPAYTNKLWIAGGRYVWENTKTWASTAEDNGWTQAFDLTTGGGDPAASATALAARTFGTAGSAKHVEYAAWCGSCSSTTFNNGIATNVTGSWKQLPMKDSTGNRLPKRYISAVTIDPSDSTGKTVYATFNSFSARYIQGYGSGMGHVWKSTDGGQTFTDVSGAPSATDSLPDVPASDLVIAPTGSMYLATDLGVYVHPVRSPVGHWEKLGTGLPTTISSDLVIHQDPDGTYLYDGTFGRGIWKVKL
ncbi:MAG TPA: glycosyl hydrolase [Actinomycetes bacterium]